MLWYQGSGNFEIWIGPADDDDVINEPISKKKNMYISPVTKTNDNWQSYNLLNNTPQLCYMTEVRV